MSLSMPLHEFSRLRLVAKMSPTGNISLSFKPLDGENALLHKSCMDSSVSLHFNNTYENGVSELTIYVASNETSSEPSTHHNASIPADVDAELIANDFVWPDIFGDMLLKIPLPTPSNESFDVANEYSAGLISGDTFFPNQAGITHSSEDHMNSLSVSRHDFIASPCSSTSTLGASYPSSPSTSSSLDLPSVGADSDSNYLSKSRVTQPSKRRSPYGKETLGITRRSKEKQQFFCSFNDCKEIFSRKHDRMRHEVMQHGRMCEWACHECRKFFSTEKTLAKHKCTSRIGDTRWIAPGTAGNTLIHSS